VASSRFEMRPRRVGELFDLSFRLVWRSKARTIPLILVYAVFYAVVSVVLSRVQFLAFLLIMGAAMVLLGALLEILRACYDGKKASIVDSLKLGTLRTPHLLVYFIVAMLMTWLSFIPLGIAFWFFSLIGRSARVLGALFSIVGFFASVAFGALIIGMMSIGSVIVVTERIGPLKAINRVWTLTSGRRRSIAGLFSVYIVFLGVLYVIALVSIFTQIRVVFGSVESSSISPWIFVVLAIVMILVLMSYPVVMAMSVTSYVDLLVRKEGLDLAELATHLNPIDTSMGTSASANFPSPSPFPSAASPFPSPSFPPSFPVASVPPAFPASPSAPLGDN
jgi:hypothetical protein